MNTNFIVVVVDNFHYFYHAYIAHFKKGEMQRETSYLTGLETQ